MLSLKHLIMRFTLVLSILVLNSTALAVHIINIEDFLTKNLEDGITTEDLRDFDIENFLNTYGYPFESHEVTTEDGYILGLHRIPNGKNESVNTYEDKIKPSVLLMHGLGSSSVDYFILGPERSLPLMLADQGYDVWLGNNRGNTWSRKHKILDPDKNATFWDYSFHELGMYDIPAIIDHVLEDAGNQNISYIGHSQGCTQFLVTASMIPEYNEKINLMVALGPAAYSSNMFNPLVQIIKDHFTVLELVEYYTNLTEIFPHSTLLSTVAKILCAETGEYHELCAIGFFLLFGPDSDQLNKTEVPILLDNFPAGTSFKEFKHFLQEVKSGHFRQYDYGLIKNLEIYDQHSPPDYNVSLITAPIALYYGKNDWLVSTKDVDRLSEELPNVVEKHLIDYKYFNHIDFIMAIDVASILYYDVINILNEYNGLDPITSTTVISVTTVTGATENGTVVTPSNSPTTTEDVTTSSSVTPESPSPTPSSVESLYSVINVVSTCFGLLVANLLV